MAKTKPSKRSKIALEDRFDFIGDGVALAERASLGSAIFDVEEKSTGAELSLKLWRKTGKPVDEDLRQLWLHEMRQVQRVMSYAGARDVVVDVMEFVEDDREFGVLLERVGQPLSERRKRVSRQHWLRNLGAPRPRILFWNNIKRVVRALGIIHAQGLVHGHLAADVIMTEGADEADFRLGGFEWSLWLAANSADRSHAKIGPDAAASRAESYSFEADWRALGLVIAECLDAEIKPSGDVQATGKGGSSIALHVPERVLIKRFVAPSRMDQLDADSISRAIDDLVASVARALSARAGTFILTFDRQAKLGEAVYDVTNGEIPIDEYRRQLEWVRADLDGGATLLVPRAFDAASSWVRLVTDAMVYRLRAFRDEGVPVWDVAVCQAVDVRSGTFSLGENDEHPILQPVSVAANSREAQELRARLGPDALDWSTFASRDKDSGASTENDAIRRALLLVQVIEAVVKALEVYPVEILDTGRRDGRKFVILRAEPNSDRDRIAKKIGLSESAVALSRLFEEEHRDAEAKWRLSQAASLGATRVGDVVVTFVDIVDHRGRRGYQFEIDEDLPASGPFFLRTERDTGTEQVIARRLRNIKALDTRVDLTDMLADPWRVRQSSREVFSDEDKKDEAFLDLDKPKQDALIGLWSTLPSYFVVGPPGVGKTKLATEVVRRRFLADRSTRMLISAQGHDALDNLQEKIAETLSKAGLADLLVVRSTTSERRPTSDEEVHRAGLSYLERLSQSTLARDAPAPTRSRISVLKAAASRLETAKDTVDRDERSGLGAVSHLILDAANIVISTANSPDVERLVEAREQFDWVVVEEAAKATGPELIGPLMLSGRRLLIGDHHQLPPFEADRLVKILADHSSVSEALNIAEQLIGPLLRDGELDELNATSADAPRLREIADMALRLLEPFRTFVEDDERRTGANPGHRRIAATLTEQRRMDPAIAEIVSKGFYQGRLTTEAGRARAAEKDESPITQLGALPRSPVVVVNFPHVSSTGQSNEIERGRPRWHNPSEVQSVVDVLRLVRAKDAKKPPKLEEARKGGAEVRIVSVEGGGPSMSHEANLNRLSDIAARGWDEQVALIDGRTATMRDDEYMVLRVIDREPQGLPESAGQELCRLVGEAAALPRGTTSVPITYAGPREISDDQPIGHACTINTNDVVIGGSAQRECLELLLEQAHRRVVVHSTFLDASRFKDMSAAIRAACIRGVSFDLLWGAEKDEDTESRNAAAASQIATIVREDSDLRGRFRVHMRTTGSHAKLILLDTAEDGWIAGVGSCNWFSSPFQSVELSVVLRDQHVVADIAVALQRLVGRRGLSDNIATEMAINARDMRRTPSPGGNATVSILVGTAHDRLIRMASSEAKHRFVIGSNRLGSTARPGALMQGEVAASREGVQATLLYTQTSGPLKNRHARALAEEAKGDGVLLRKTKKIPLHGKFVAWDDDDLVVTSLNWASASADPDFPWGEIGVHIHAPLVASEALSRLAQIFPELADGPSATQDA